MGFVQNILLFYIKAVLYILISIESYVKDFIGKDWNKDKEQEQIFYDYDSVNGDFKSVATSILSSVQENDGHRCKRIKLLLDINMGEDGIKIISATRYPSEKSIFTRILQMRNQIFTILVFFLAKLIKAFVKLAIILENSEDNSSISPSDRPKITPKRSRRRRTLFYTFNRFISKFVPARIYKIFNLNPLTGISLNRRIPSPVQKEEKIKFVEKRKHSPDNTIDLSDEGEETSSSGSRSNPVEEEEKNQSLLRAFMESNDENYESAEDPDYIPSEENKDSVSASNSSDVSINSEEIEIEKNDLNKEIELFEFEKSPPSTTTITADKNEPTKSILEENKSPYYFQRNEKGLLTIQDIVTCKSVTVISSPREGEENVQTQTDNKCTSVSEQDNDNDKNNKKDENLGEAEEVKIQYSISVASEKNEEAVVTVVAAEGDTPAIDKEEEFKSSVEVENFENANGNGSERTNSNKRKNKKNKKGNK